ncbi:MAG: dicarboxylate/amino acid:cation symporter [Sphingomonas sp.]
MSQAIRVLAALVLGLLAGIGAALAGGGWAATLGAVAEPIGTAWLNGLQMTIVPLVVALIVTGIAQTADAGRAGTLAGRSMALYLGVLWSGAIMAALLAPVLIQLWPIDREAAAALTSAIKGVAAPGNVPGFGEIIGAMVPSNPVAAAANSAFLPLVVFTLAFAFAVTRLEAAPRALLVGFFQALADAMLVVIGWVLWLAPLGVAALAFQVGVKAGGAAFGALLHYVLFVGSIGMIVWLAAYPLALIGGRVSLGKFLKASAPAQVVAISTQSSLASLPAMLRGAEALGIADSASGITLPLAVAMFRSTGPAMNLAVAVYVAALTGTPVTPASLIAGVVVAGTTTLGAVSLPGSISFINSIAPIAAAMGVPIAPLGLLVAIETFPDLVRTLGNVTMDLATTTVLGRGAAEKAATPAA